MAIRAVKPSLKPPLRRYYVVTAAPEDHRHLLGIHYCIYGDLQIQLPSGNLAGAGCSFEGYDVLQFAADYWVACGWALPTPYFD